MNAVVTLEQRFLRTPEGAIWTQAAFAFPFWKRYLEVFDGVRVAARVSDVAAPPAAYVRADGAGVTFTAVPFYLGPWQYLRRASAVRRTLAQALGRDDAVIMRVASQLANCLFPRLQRRGQPYGLEVVGDPWDVFAPGTIRHPLRPLLRRYFTGQLQAQCRHACGVAYVTEQTLQRRYPVGDRTVSASFSSVELADRAVARKRRPPALSVAVSDVELPNERLTDQTPRDRLRGRAFRIIFVGSLEQLYKAPEVLVGAVAQCVREGLDLQLTMIGDGRFLPKLMAQAERLDIAGRVQFRGQLPAGRAVQEELDRADLFVLPSRTEGLPRALIEAMARGLPCIGSTAGGIPELLPPEDLVPPGDAHALARRIREVVSDPARMERMSGRNRGRATDFREDVLRERRLVFYRFVREYTEEWLATGSRW